MKHFVLTADTQDANGIMYYYWVVNGVQVIRPTSIYGDNARIWEGDAELGPNDVQVMAIDNAGNNSNSSELWSWTYVGDIDVHFGDGIILPVDPVTGETNSVAFTSVDFRPGEASSFTMSGFEAANEEISGLQLWLVTRESLDGSHQYKAVEGTATYDTGTNELTVTLPAEATEDMDSFFVLGIDNKEP